MENRVATSSEAVLISFESVPNEIIVENASPRDGMHLQNISFVFPLIWDNVRKEFGGLF